MMTSTNRTTAPGGGRALTRNLGWMVALLLLAAPAARGQITEVGGVARDFTVVDRATGSPVHLTDFAGQVVLLDFFAYWCGPCQASSPDVEVNVKQYFDARGGNSHGVPVKVLAVNIESSNESATDDFIANAGLDSVANDYARDAYGQFQTGGIPLFVIINGVDASPSHLLWQVIYREAGYAGASTLRGYINSVQAANPTAPPHVLTPPKAQTLPAGECLQLNVQATGAGPFAYQWFKDGAALPGATNQTFQCASAQPADSGSYAVDVANDFGTSRSASATVVVVRTGPPKTYAYSGAAVAIPDGNSAGVTTQITVPDALQVVTLRISLHITHSYRGDLKATLRSPGGKVVTLFDVSDDSSDNVVLTASPVAGFYGLSAQGTWSLNVSDTYTPDAGRLDSWSITITPPAPSLSAAFTQWIGGFTELPEAQRAPAADPDGDGVPNLLEYLLAGQSPVAAAGRPALAPSASAPGCIDYAVNWRSGVDTSNCTVWMCEDLSTGVWTQVADRAADIVVDRSVTDRLAVRCRKTLPGVFLQLRVTGAGL